MSPSTSGVHCDPESSGLFPAIQLAQEASNLFPVAGFVNEEGGDGVRPRNTAAQPAMHAGGGLIAF